MEQKIFDINDIESTAIDLKYEIVEKSEKSIKIKLINDWILVFENIEQNDTIIYFENSMSWHTHGDLFTSEEIKINDVPLLILLNIRDGKYLLVGNSYKNHIGKIDRRFDDLNHISGDIHLLEAGESVCFQKV